MKQRFGYCNDCKNTDCCEKCYRGSYYERDHEDEDDDDDY